MKFVFLVSFILLVLAENKVCTAAAFEEETENDHGKQEDSLNKEVSEDKEDDVNNESLEISTATEQDVVLRIKTGSSGGGVTYTMFGKKSCPTGAELVYDGLAAGGWYNQKGNGANYLCMPHNPQYLSTRNVPWPSYLYGAEYESNNQIFSKRPTHNYNVPCAVCYRPKRSTQIMIPANVKCPTSWQREYYGYLMSSYHGHAQNIKYECVHYIPDTVPGSQGNTNGALFYFVQVECNRGLPCGPYIRKRAVTCVVCTK